jgi:hypothetical protein
MLITLSYKKFLMMMKRMTRMLVDHLIDEFVEHDSSKDDFHVRTRDRVDDLIESHNDEMSKLMNEEV